MFPIMMKSEDIHGIIMCCYLIFMYFLVLLLMPIQMLFFVSGIKYFFLSFFPKVIRWLSNIVWWFKNSFTCASQRII